MEDHIGAGVKEGLDWICLIGQFFAHVRGLYCEGGRNLGHPKRRHSRNGTGFSHAADIFFRHKVQVRQNIVLLLVSGNLQSVLNAAQHEVSCAAALGVTMDGQAFFIGLYNELNHLVMAVETLHAMIAGLVGIILVLPARMSLRDTVQEALDTHNVQIVAVIFGPEFGGTCNFCLGVFHIVRRQCISISAQFEFAFFLQFMVCLCTFRIEKFQTGVTHTGEAAAQCKILPSKQEFLGILHCLGQIVKHLHYRSFADITVRISICVHVHLCVTHLLGIFRIYSGPFQRL